MKQRLVLIFAVILIAKVSYSQMVDRYGINIGTSYFTQIWDYKLLHVDSDSDYKFGLQAFLQAEKDFGKTLALRTEFGYMQKGFKDNTQLLVSDGITMARSNDCVILHNLGIVMK